MLSTEELVSTYEKYTDDELFEVYSKIETYSQEAKKALDIVIIGKGGIESLLNRLGEKKVINAEIERIVKEVKTSKNRKAEIYYLKQIITSDILPKEKVSEIIDTTFSELKSEEDDRKIKPSTIGGSILGDLCQVSLEVVYGAWK